jgi:hypothetical protein
MLGDWKEFLVSVSRSVILSVRIHPFALIYGPLRNLPRPPLAEEDIERTDKRLAPNPQLVQEQHAQMCQRDFAGLWRIAATHKRHRTR